MPEIAAYHPQLVHFAIALCGVGVAFRLVSLTGRASWTNPGALTLLLAGAILAVLAATSGDQAHDRIERIPGILEAVKRHQTLGDRTRNVFLAVAGLELLGFALRRGKAARIVPVLSAAVGVGGLFLLYQTAQRGGELVYSYGGGPGVRTGDSADVTRLLVAGLYQRALADRAAGRGEDAARLIEELVRRRAGDPAVELLAAESLLRDRRDAAGAMDRLRRFQPAQDPRLRIRQGLLLSEAFVAAGQRDSARALLLALRKDFPASRGVAQALDGLR